MVNENLKNIFKTKKFLSRLIPIKSEIIEKLNLKIKNDYLKFKANDENMNFVYALARLLKIKDNSFIKSMNSFQDYHIGMKFLKKRVLLL